LISLAQKNCADISSFLAVCAVTLLGIIANKAMNTTFCQLKMTGIFGAIY